MARSSCVLLYVHIAVLFALLIAMPANSGGINKLVPGFRPPSVPLVVVDPYLSIWSNADHLYDGCPKHWSGPTVCLSGMIRIDGKSYRYMANSSDLAPEHMKQVDLKVYPTQTEYIFQQNGVQLIVTFSSPAFVDEDILPTLPMTFISYNITILDSMAHDIQLYYDNTAEGVVSIDSEMVSWERVSMIGYVSMRVGTKNQCYLCQNNDRINWGYWYVSTLLGPTVRSTMTTSSLARKAFMTTGKLPPDILDSSSKSVMALAWDFGTVQPSTPVSRHMSIVYDQVYSIKYFGTAMVPLWKHAHDNVSNLIMRNGYNQIKTMCDHLDEKVLDKLYTVGGEKYATISSLAWRQAVAGTVAVWNNVTNTTWMFMKEISSDGDVSTVDVLYPASPLFLSFNYNSMKLLLLPVLDYANNQSVIYGHDIPYNLSWAPHHLGHWPVCLITPNMQEQMPMEESGNMILMMAGIVFQSPTKDVEWIKPYWKVLIQWGDHMVSGLPDPGDQLCTDDFEGPSPHNVNLAAKGIVGLAALSYLLRIDGRVTLAEKYERLNKEQFIKYWLEKAIDNDHYRLQYNEKGTWSLKYNMLFQKILKLDVFPQSVVDMEESFYSTQMNTYGVPLDNRADFAKVDWEIWVASIGNKTQFTAIVDAVFKFLNETPDRVPFTDWYYTSTGKRKGFIARPVVGGLYAKLLTD